MNRLFATSAVTIGLYSSAWAQTGPQTDATESDCSYELRGRVFDADLNTPVAKALIASDAFADVVRSDEMGRIVIKRLCPGTVAFTVSKPGYAPQPAQLVVPTSGPITIRIAYAMQSITITAPLDDPLSYLGFSDTIDGAELVETRGLTLGDALSRASGVQVLRSGAVTKPVIDGFYGNRVLILNDGLRHHAQLWALDHAAEIDPFSANRLTVVRGADGVRYGADAIGGSILIDPVPFVEPTQAGLTGEGNLVGLSNGRQGIINGQISGPVPGLPRLSIRAQGSFKKAGSLDAPDYPLDNTGIEDIAGGAALRYLGRGWEASIGVSQYRTEYGIFSGIRSESIRDFEDAIAQGQPRNVDLYEFSYDVERAFSRVDHIVARTDIRIDLTDNITLDLAYGFQSNDRREFDVVRVDSNKAQLSFVLDSHAVDIAFEHHWGSHWNGLVGFTGLLQTNDHEGRRLIPDFDRLVGGLFAIQKYAGDHFEVSAGVRYERQTFDTSQPTRIAPNQNPPEQIELDFDAIMATVGLTFNPDPAWQFNFHLAYATRIPTIDELFLDGLLPGEVFVVTGDRELNPEKTLNAGIGIAYAHRWFEAEVTAYVHRIDDYIYRAPALNEDGTPRFTLLITGLHPAVEYRNINALYAGGTVSIDVRPCDWLSWASEASYVRARNLQDGTFLINIPPDRYQNRVTINVPQASIVRNTQIWLESVFVRRQDEFDINADFDEPPDAYHLVNAGVSTAFSIGPQELRASIDLQNLFNAAYRDYLSRLRFFADEPGFNAIARLSFAFDVAFDRKGAGDSPSIR